MSECWLEDASGERRFDWRAFRLQNNIFIFTFHHQNVNSKCNNDAPRRRGRGGGHVGGRRGRGQRVRGSKVKEGHVFILSISEQQGLKERRFQLQRKEKLR